MLQILVWGICVMIIGIGLIIRWLEVLATPIEKRKTLTGYGSLLFMFFLALIIFALSIFQGGEIQKALQF